MDEQTVPTRAIPNFDQRVTQIGDKLDKIIEGRQLAFSAEDPEINEIFTLPAEHLGKMPVQKLEEYSFILSRYNVYLRRELNKQRGLLNWAKKSMDFIVLPNMHQYREPYMSIDEIKMRAIKDHDVAQKFYKFIIDKDNEIITIEELNTDIRKMADTLSGIAKTKKFSN